jgi:DNA-binding NarL/FixJ family response regulator
MRVLIVDDSAAVRERLGRLLREAGAAHVLEACDAEAALRLLGRTVVEAVLLDLRVGAPDSFAVIRQVRTRSPQAMVVVLTNDSSETHRRAWLQGGADLLFDKSRQFEEAVEAVTRRAAGTY